MTDEKNKKRPHNLILDCCEKMSLSGVYDVGSFDEHIIICYTDYGELVIKGEKLHIGSMSVDNGDMEITGKVSSVIYTGEKKPGGIFSKLFK